MHIFANAKIWYMFGVKTKEHRIFLILAERRLNPL